MVSDVWAQNQRVIALRSSRLSIYDQALEGFRQCLRDQGLAITLEDIVLPDNDAGITAVVEGLKQDPPSLVLTLGSNASLLAKERLAGIPFVFCMTVDPRSNGLTQAGVTLDVNPDDQIGYLKKHFPRLKRIGVIYNPERNREEIALIKQLGARGDTTIVFESIVLTEDFTRAIESLKDRADCLLMITNSHLYSPQMAPQIILQTLRLGLPLIAVSPSFVKAGAMLGIYADSHDNGCLAARVAARLLKGEPPADIPIQRPARIKSAVNKVVAERLKINIPSSALLAAEQVIE